VTITRRACVGRRTERSWSHRQDDVADFPTQIDKTSTCFFRGRTGTPPGSPGPVVRTFVLGKFTEERRIPNASGRIRNDNGSLVLPFPKRRERTIRFSRPKVGHRHVVRSAFSRSATKRGTRSRERRSDGAAYVIRFNIRGRIHVDADGKWIMSIVFRYGGRYGNARSFVCSEWITGRRVSFLTVVGGFA